MNFMFFTKLQPIAKSIARLAFTDVLAHKHRTDITIGGYFLETLSIRVCVLFERTLKKLPFWFFGIVNFNQSMFILLHK